jgi:hypothetical protein
MASIKYFIFISKLHLFSLNIFNLLAPEFGILILAHPVCKIRIIQEPKKVALRNKRHFEEKETEECAACIKNSVLIFVEKNIHNWVFGG